MHSIFTLVLLWSFCTFDAAVGFRAYRRALSARCRKYSKQAWTNPDLYEQRYPAQSVCRRINIAPVGILPSLSSFRAGIGALSAVSSSSTDPARSPYIGAAVETAKARVEHMLRKHQSENDPLLLRMSHMADRCDFNFSNAIRRNVGQARLFGLSVICDMKRASPFIQSRTSIVDYPNAELMASFLLEAGADALVVSTEPSYYLGSETDLVEAVRACNSFRNREVASATARLHCCIQKDVIIHPVQIANAVELGASGVLLIAGVVGADLPSLLDSATLMGTEALVEVHTPNELEFALSCGASLFLINTRDRFSGVRYPNQVRALSSLLPMNSIALACGGFGADINEIKELGYLGYDGVVIGRAIADVPDLPSLVAQIHGVTGVRKEPSIGMKFWNGMQDDNDDK